jgi:hypothetical protein
MHLQEPEASREASLTALGIHAGRKTSSITALVLFSVVPSGPYLTQTVFLTVCVFSFSTRVFGLVAWRVEERQGIFLFWSTVGKFHVCSVAALKTVASHFMGVFTLLD